MFFPALQLTSLLEKKRKKTLKIFVGMLTRLVWVFFFIFLKSMSAFLLQKIIRIYLVNVFLISELP